MDTFQTEEKQRLLGAGDDAGGAQDSSVSWFSVVFWSCALFIVLVGLPFYNKQVFGHVADEEQRLAPLPANCFVTSAVGAKNLCVNCTVAGGDPIASCVSTHACLEMSVVASQLHCDLGSGVVALVPTIVMLLGACVVLSTLEVIRHCVFAPREQSWLLHDLKHKWKHLLVPALLFGAVMGLTNTSLSLTSVNLHVLLRTSMIIWLVFGAWLVEGERPSLLTLVWCGALAAGAIMGSWHSSSQWSVYWVAVLLTALSAIAQAALLVATRRAARILGTKSSMEVAATKALVAACILLPVAGGVDPTGWTRLARLDSAGVGFLVGGIFVTSLFQALLVAAQSVTLATSVGVLSIVAVIPQILISLLAFKKQQHLMPVQIVGYVVAPLAALGYAAERIWRARKEKRNRNHQLVN